MALGDVSVASIPALDLLDRLRRVAEDGGSALVVTGGESAECEAPLRLEPKDAAHVLAALTGEVAGLREG
jgi:hypothetical protein